MLITYRFKNKRRKETIKTNLIKFREVQTTSDEVKMYAVFPPSDDAPIHGLPVDVIESIVAE